MKKVVVAKELYLFSLGIYLICMPLGAMNIGLVGSALKIVAVLPVLAAVFGSRCMKIRLPIFTQIAFACFAAISVLWSIAYNVSIERVISYVLLLLVLLSGCFFSYTEKEVDRIKRILVWSSRVTVIAVLLFGGLIENRLYLNGIINEDPNYLCAYFLFGVIAALQRTTYDEKGITKVKVFLELTIYLYLILSTGSRGGLLAIMAGVAVYFLNYEDFFSRKSLIKVVTLILLLFVFLLLMYILPDELRMRFTVDSVADSGGSGRTQIWANISHVLSNSNLGRQLFGYGTGTIKEVLAQFGFPPKVAHNIFLETLVELGVTGLLVYAFSIFSFIKVSFGQKDKFALCVIVGMFVLSLSTSIYTFKPYYNIMLYILLCQRKESRDRNQLAD